MIAVLLGWAILSEDLTPSIVAGAVVIVASVAFVVRQESLSRAPAPARSVPTMAAPGEPRSAPGDVAGP